VKILAYHGTSAQTAQKILQEGFNPGTYFAWNLDDALEGGESHVLGVMFSRKGPPSNWQFRTQERVTPSRIVFYKVFKVKEVMLDTALSQEIQESQLAEYKVKRRKQ